MSAALLILGAVASVLALTLPDLVAGDIWPTIALLLGLVVAAVLALPAVVRDGRRQVGKMRS